MEGQVFVPYTGIGGSNLDSGIMPFNLAGSTEEPAPSGSISTNIGVRWSYPGGIMNGGTYEYGFWGYALYRMSDGADYTYDRDVVDWLLGNSREEPTPRYILETPFSQTQIDNGAPEVVEKVNEMVRQYVYELIFVVGGGDISTFRTVFASCIYPA